MYYVFILLPLPLSLQTGATLSLICTATFTHMLCVSVHLQIQLNLYSLAFEHTKTASCALYCDIYFSFFFSAHTQRDPLARIYSLDYIYTDTYRRRERERVRFISSTQIVNPFSTTHANGMLHICALYHVSLSLSIPCAVLYIRME